MKAKTYKQNSVEYQNLIQNFINRFNNYFGSNTAEQKNIRSLFNQNLKTLKKHEGTSFKKFLLGYLSGIYLATKTLEYTEEEKETIIHELFHALSHKAFRKRESILKFLLSIYGAKELSIREFEEGMTEYLANCLMGEEYKYYRFAYAHETDIVYKLARIYGDVLVLDYYLGINNNLIAMVNKTSKNAFQSIVKLCCKVSTNEEVIKPFDHPCYYKKGKKIYDDLLYKLFAKEKLKEVKTIDDFKYNMNNLFYFYESDLYTIALDISNNEAKLEEQESPKQKAFYENDIRESAKLYSIFYQIIKKEWHKLGINNDELFNQLLLSQIESSNEFSSSVILDYLEYWHHDLYQAYQEKSNSQPQNNLNHSYNNKYYESTVPTLPLEEPLEFKSR